MQLPDSWSAANLRRAIVSPTGWGFHPVWLHVADDHACADGAGFDVVIAATPREWNASRLQALAAMVHPDGWLITVLAAEHECPPQGESWLDGARASRPAPAELRTAGSIGRSCARREPAEVAPVALLWRRASSTGDVSR